MNYFLAKTEPEEYSIDDLARDGTSVWTGVNNPQAKNFLKSMKKGDLVYIYHTGTVRAIVGIATVSKEGEPPTFAYVSHLNTPVTLASVKAEKQFADLKLVRQGRLSVMELPENFVKWVKDKSS